MKKLSMIIGPLLFVLSTSASAASSELCEQVLGYEAISPYVRYVMQRATDGIGYAKSAPDNPDAELYRQSWNKDIDSTVSAAVDSQLTLTEQFNDLPHNSACLHFDLLLIQCKMEEVRKEMMTQLDEGSFLGIQRLRELYTFLNERFRHVLRGSLDPTYPDPGRGERYLFDPPGEVWCCLRQGDQMCRVMSDEECENEDSGAYMAKDQCLTECSEAEEPSKEDPPLCPFHSNYAPPSSNGFGCDETVLEAFQDFPPLKREYDALTKVVEQIDAYREAAQKFLGIQQELDALFNKESSIPPPPPPREHKIAYGCMEPQGVCADDSSVRCDTDSECTSVGQNGCDILEKVCSLNRLRACANDVDCGSDGACVEDDGSEPVLRGIRGSFSATRNVRTEIEIVSSFLEERVRQGVSREFEDDLKLSDEFPPEKEAESERRKTEGPFTQGTRVGIRETVRGWSRVDGAAEALIFPQAVDASMETAHALSPLRAAVGEIARIAHDKEGLRAFVVRFAYFLRRTCVHRACNKSLEQMLRIAFQDDCFPYTNGEYLSDSADSPRWEKCAKAACIKVPGVELPDECTPLIW